MSTEGNQLRHDKILAFVVAAVADPSLVAVYREAGTDYLRRDWGFSDEDIDYIQQQPPADAPSGGPATFGDDDLATASDCLAAAADDLAIDLR